MILRPFKKIREQKEKIDELLKEIEKYKRKEEDRQRKEKTENHNIGVWCEGCVNLLETSYINPALGIYADRFCKLDCKCEDRKENE